MGKSIYNTCVKVKSLIQVQRLIEACQKEKIKSDIMPFNKKSDYFRVSSYDKKTFANWHGNHTKLTKISESEFIELLKTTK